MCMELMYENSNTKHLVDISYLAVGDNIIINKTYTSDEEDYEILETFGYFNTELWMRIVDKNKNSVLTILINYDDTGDWDSSLQKVLVSLGNEGFNDALFNNLFEMFWDAIHAAGLINTQVGTDISLILEGDTETYCRTVDFMMHAPTSSDIHPGYDT